MDIVNQFPVLPIRIPGLDLWCTEIIEEVARIWHAEIAWCKFAQSITRTEFKRLPDIKSMFSQQFKPNGTTTARAVKRARQSIFGTMYQKAGPISRLFEIQQAYKGLQPLLGDKSLAGAPWIPVTKRPLRSQGCSTARSNTRGEFSIDTQSPDYMTDTPPLATQFPPVRHISGARSSEKAARDHLNLENRIAKFQYELNGTEYENFSEVIRTLYERACDGDFRQKKDISLIYEHISDFYATKILTKAEVARVKPQASVAGSSRTGEPNKAEPIHKTKQPIERTQKAHRKEATAVSQPTGLTNRDRRAQLQAALAEVKRKQESGAARNASVSQERTSLEAPRNPPRSRDSAAVPPRQDLGDEAARKLTKKASRKSLGSQENVKAPVARPSTPTPVGEPMEGIAIESKNPEPSNGLRSKKGRLNIRHSMPTSLEGPKTETSGKHEPSAKRQAHGRLSHPGPGAEHPSRAQIPSTVSRSPIVIDSTPPLSGKPTAKLPLKATQDASSRKVRSHDAPKAPASDVERTTAAPLEKVKDVAPPPIPSESEHEQPLSTPQRSQSRAKKSQIEKRRRSDSPPQPASPPKSAVKIKEEPSDINSIITNSEARGPTRPDTEVSVPQQPEDLLTRLNRTLELLRNEKEQDKVLPERTRVPEEQAKSLATNAALWPQPKRELQKHMRAVPNLEPRDNGNRTCRYPEDFEPYNSTIETSTEPGTQASKGKEKADAENQPENPAPGEQHVFTLASQPAEEDGDSDDEPVVDWPATPPSQLKDPFNRPNEVFEENSDVESVLDNRPPPGSSVQTPEASEYERTPRKVKGVTVKTNTLVSSLRKAVAEKYTPPRRRPPAFPVPPSSAPSSPELPVVTHQVVHTATRESSDLDEEMGLEEPQPVDKEEEGSEEEEGVEVEEEYNDDDDDEEEEEEEEEEGESEVQVLQTQSSPARRHQTPQPQGPQVNQGVQITPRVISSSQVERPETPRSSPNVSKRKADQISVSPAKAGSAVSPMIRNPKVLKMEVSEIGEMLVKRASAAVASSKEGVRNDLNISAAELAKGRPGRMGTVRAQLAMERDAYFNSLEHSDSDSG
ncbi:hypothetical protein TWF281_010306 [Arthrobotrys megalospora]